MPKRSGVALALALPSLLGVWWISRLYTHRDEYRPNPHEAAADASAELARIPDAERRSRIEAALEHNDPWMRRMAIDSLPVYKTPHAWNAVEKALQDSASIVRIRALEVAADIDRKRGVRALLAGLLDEDTWMRHAAIAQISTRAGRRGSAVDRSLVPALIRVLDEKDTVSVTMAMAALRRLTGEQIRPPRTPTDEQTAAAAERWRRWWREGRARFAAEPHLQGVTAFRPTRSSPAPNFSLQTLDGRVLNNADMKGKPVLLNFWGSWCPPCREEIPALEKVHRELSDRGLQVVGIAVSETEGAAEFRNTCAKLGISYPVAFGAEGILRAFGDIHELPVSIMLDRQGRIRYQWEGDRDAPTFRYAAQRLLAE
jgi:peroxiredoxin